MGQKNVPGIQVQTCPNWLQASSHRLIEGTHVTGTEPTADDCRLTERNTVKMHSTPFILQNERLRVNFRPTRDMQILMPQQVAQEG
nr:hypothetical protein [Deinococcus fonticola]